MNHTHGHAHVDEPAMLDPNAAWFAPASILVKAWNYRATKRVAADMKSTSLTTNAYHHRPDAYSFLVPFLAIAGTWVALTLPLGPLGGIDFMDASTQRLYGFDI